MVDMFVYVKPWIQMSMHISFIYMYNDFQQNPRIKLNRKSRNAQQRKWFHNSLKEYLLLL